MRKKSKKYLLGLSLVSAIALNMAHPVTPMLIGKLGLPSFMFGVFFATMSLGNFIFSPVFGALSDKKGRIRYLVMGLIGYGLSQLGFGYSSNVFIIVIFRFLGGAFVTGYLTISIAYLIDITKEKERLKYMAYYAAATTIGSALGSLLGGVIGNNNYKNTFLVQCILCIVISIVLFLILEETLKSQEGKVRLSFEILFPFRKEIKLEGKLVVVIVLVAIFYFASTSYNSTINFYIEKILNLPPSFIGAFLAVAGIMGFLANIILTPKIGKRFKDKNSFDFITLLLGMLMLIIALVPNTIAFFIFIIIFVMVCSIYVPIQQNIVSKLSKNNHGALMGIQNSSKAVGMIMGSLFSGFIFDFGSKLPFLFSAIALFVGYFILKVKGKNMDL